MKYIIIVSSTQTVDLSKVAHVLIGKEKDIPNNAGERDVAPW